MNPLEQHLQRVSEKLQLLLKRYKALQKDNERLKQELFDLKQADAARAQQLEDLEQKVIILKTATNNMTEQDKKDLEKKLNQYIREIDRCIAVLSE